MPFANLSKSIRPGNHTGKADGSAQDTCFRGWRSRATRRHCGCASNSSCDLVTKRTVIFALPLIERANDVSAAINTASWAVARGTFMPGKRERIVLAS